jgi:hypothetical protein
MPVLHDLACPAPGCTEERFNEWWPTEQVCPVHALPLEIVYHPKHYRPFEAFTYEEEGTGRQVEVNSLHQLREIEARSVAEWERGAGRPVIFRQFTQDRSNRDENVFQKLHPQVERSKLVTRNSRGIPYITHRTGPPIPYEED